MGRSRWLALGAALLGGCGLNVSSPDLFLLARTGEGHRLSLLVNDGGTVSCNGGATRHLPGPLLLRGRDITLALDGDAKRSLRIPSPSGSVFRYVIRLQDGTIAFPDVAARRHSELARVELFALQVAQEVCGLPG